MPLFKESLDDVFMLSESEIGGKGKIKRDFRCPTHVRMRAKTMLKDFQAPLALVSQSCIVLICKLFILNRKVNIDVFCSVRCTMLCKSV